MAKFLVKPFLNPETLAERRFNHRLCAICTKSTENIIGFLKLRFAILGKKTIGIRIERVPNVIVAGVALFNFILSQGEDPEIDEEELDQEEEEEDEQQAHQEGLAAVGDAAMLAQGEAHRAWLVDNFCT